MTEETYNNIEDYFSGNMSKTDHEAFEQRLALSDELQNDLEAYQISEKGIQLSGLNEDLKMLKDLETDIQTHVIPSDKKESQTFWRSGPLRIAASILLLAGMGWLLFNLIQPSVDHGDLFAQNFEVAPASNVGTTRGDDYGIKECFTAYNKEKWSVAIPCLETLSPSTDLHYYYLGIAYLADGLPEKAITSFEQVGELPIKEINEDVLWYSALAYLRMGALESVEEILSRIDGPKYREQIKTILKDI